MPFHTAAAGEYEIMSIQAQPDRIVSALDVFPTVSEGLLQGEFERAPGFFGETCHELRFTQNIGLVLGNGRMVIVDTGIPPGSPDALLLGGLEEAGVALSDIDTVILSHRDLDHVGGNLLNDEPLFPRARYVIGQTEYEQFQLDPVRAENFVKYVGSLEKFGVLDVIEDDAEVAPGYRLWFTPGHRSGATSVLVGDVALLLADVWHSALQVADTSISIKFDSDPHLAAITRAEVVERAERENLLVHVPHTPFFGLGRIQSKNGVRSWVPTC